ncbi:hypothetical protein DV735_g5035, partial [Chaetothyriales sp. CBS 134920]
MILQAEATRAKEIASILDTFSDYVAEHRKAIDHTADNLETLSFALSELDRQLSTLDDGVPSRKFADDLELLQHSVAYTFGDLWTILGDMPDECIGIDYRKAWKAIVSHTDSARRESLHMRIEAYSLFTSALCRMLRGQSQRRGILIEDLRADINSLRMAQLNTRTYISAAEAISDLAKMQQNMQKPAPQPQSPAIIKQPRSAERVRPAHLRPKTPESVETRETRSPPISPLSPQTTFSSINSQASSGEVEVVNHWVSHIFENLPSTRIVDQKNRDQRSACHPLPHDRDKWPCEREYERILKIIFPGGLKMHYYLRGRDYSTKIACEWPRDRHGNQESCLSLCDLHVKRSGSALYLCRPVAGYSNNTVWAQFICPTFEWLVVFHLTFLALRSQDQRQQPAFPDLFDRELKGETRCFAGVITDNGCHHALRLYRDRSTGVIRLEAAVLKGSMKNTPVWTAFITHQVTSPTWLERADRSKSVYMVDLKRHIFSSKYTPHVAPGGQHVLAFDLLSDAEDFESMIRELGAKVLQEANR